MNLVGGIDMKQIFLIYFLNAPLYLACCLSLRCLFGHSCKTHFIFENLKMASQLLKKLANLCHLYLSFKLLEIVLPTPQLGQMVDQSELKI